jgi:membrane-associated protease RseP (regulator of RpoE activity)
VPTLADTSAWSELPGVARGFSDAGFPDALLRIGWVVPWPAALLCALAAWAILARESERIETSARPARMQASPSPRDFLAMLRCSAAITGLGLLAACTTAPTAPIPDPLPETLEWAAPSEAPSGGFLGLEVRENDSGSLEALRIDPGVRVTRVLDGSPALAAGFAVGDVLLAFDGVPVADPETLDALLADANPAAAHELEARRGDSVFRVTVSLRARETPGARGEFLWRADPVRSLAGWASAPGGVVLVSSAPGGPFPAAGVEVGSLVTELDGVAVRSDRALVRALQQREPGATVGVTFVAPGGEAAETRDVELFAPSRRLTRASVPILFGYRSSVDGSETSFTLLDLWIVSLFHYRRDGGERHVSLLSLIRFSSGVGELEEEVR